MLHITAHHNTTKLKTDENAIYRPIAICLDLSLHSLCPSPSLSSCLLLSLLLSTSTSLLNPSLFISFFLSFFLSLSSHSLSLSPSLSHSLSLSLPLFLTSSLSLSHTHLLWLVIHRPDGTSCLLESPHKHRTLWHTRD